MIKEDFPKNIDLLIIDIDDTFIYHRTVAVANKIFLSLLCDIFCKKLDNTRIYTTKRAFLVIIRVLLFNFFRIKININKIKKLAKLAKTALYLHFLNVIRNINNHFFNLISSERMIRMWAKTIVSLNIKAGEYYIPEKTIKKNLNKGILGIYNSLKRINPKMHILAMTQSFNINKDTIKNILGIDMVESNIFTKDKGGFISGFELKVKNAEDKKKIADKLISKIKPNNIALFIDDYDDVLLLKLKNLKFVLYNKRLKKFLNKKENTVRIGFH